jgi:hypothetical protein
MLRMAHPAEDIAAKRIIELAHSLIAIPSVTNQEDEIADWTPPSC